jgi:hypothetical protein
MGFHVHRGLSKLDLYDSTIPAWFGLLTNLQELCVPIRSPSRTPTAIPLRWILARVQANLCWEWAWLPVDGATPSDVSHTLAAQGRNKT